MGNKGIIDMRRVDDLGRIVIPKFMRTALDLKEGTPTKIIMDKKSMSVTICRAETMCAICSKTESEIEMEGGEFIKINDKEICPDCFYDLARKVMEDISRDELMPITDSTVDGYSLI